MYTIVMQAGEDQTPSFFEVAGDSTQSGWRAGIDLNFEGQDLQRVSWYALSKSVVRI